MKSTSFPCVPLLLCLALASCYKMRPTKGGGQIDAIPTRKFDMADVALPPGYQIEQVVAGLTFPTDLVFDSEGKIYVLEAGYSYGEVWAEPKLLRLESRGRLTTVATGEKNGPWTGVAFHEGSFYVAEGGQMEGGKILKISPEGKIQTLVSSLPSVGDHHTNVPVVKDGYVYFGQGVATNSGVVGPDNFDFGWLKRKPQFCDIPCQDVVLNGVNYESENPLTGDKNDRVRTGAYVPFGTPTQTGQVVKGAIPCTGSILRVPVGGGKLELVAWGLRNPFGLALAPDGKMYVSENAFDDRGSRPVWGAGDVIWEVKQGAWYGWPDYSEGQLIADDKEFKAPGKDKVKALLQKQPGSPPPVSWFFS